MRDSRKGREYFKAYLDYQHERIKKKTEKLQDCAGDKRQRVLISLTGFETDLLKAEFSAGASKENLRQSLMQALPVISENRNVTYDHLLTLLSLAVILDAGKDAGKLIESNRDTIGNDRLLHCISSYIEKGTKEWNQGIPLREEYGILDQVFSSNDKESALKEYLAKWYEAHSEYAWYNTHLRDTDTYCGYWSFESAAIAIIFGLDSEKISGEAYYPAL